MREYRCDDYTRTLAAYKLAVREGRSEAQAKEYLITHPFSKSASARNACPYVNVVYKTVYKDPETNKKVKGSPFMFELKVDKCKWEHSPNCTSRATTAAQSLLVSEKLRSAIASTDGKITAASMKKAAMAADIDGSGTVPKRELYRAKENLLANDKKLYDHSAWPSRQCG